MMGLSVHICWGISKIDVNFGYCVQKVLIKNLKLLIIIDYCEKKCLCLLCFVSSLSINLSVEIGILLRETGSDAGHAEH